MRKTVRLQNRLRAKTRWQQQRRRAALKRWWLATVVAPLKQVGRNTRAARRARLAKLRMPAGRKAVARVPWWLQKPKRRKAKNLIHYKFLPVRPLINPFELDWMAMCMAMRRT